MANMSWTIRPDTVIKDYNARYGQNLSSALFTWATFVVEGLYYLGDLDAVWDGYPDLSVSHQPDTVDMAHGRWAVGSAITALDLCAAALGRQYCNWTGSNELDLRGFDITSKKRAEQILARREKLHPSALAWVDGVFADPRYQMGVALKLTPAIRSRLGFYRVFGAARHQQIQKFQNLSKLEKQTHHPELGRAGSSLFNPCIINVLWGMQRLSRFVSMRRTPISNRLKCQTFLNTLATSPSFTCVYWW